LLKESKFSSDKADLDKQYSVIQEQLVKE